MIRTACIFANLLLTAVAGASGYLTIGDSAPSLAHVKWLKGGPLEIATGKLEVLVFWAAPGEHPLDGMSNPAPLVKKYGRQISLALVAVPEPAEPVRRKRALRRLTAFLKTRTEKRPYCIGITDPSGEAYSLWLKASGETNLPAAFVVGKDGRIAWIGPLGALDQPLSRIQAGAFDMQTANADRAFEMERLRPLRRAVQAKQFQQALAIIDQIQKERPEHARFYNYDRYLALVHLDLNQTKELTQEIIADSNGDITAYQRLASVYATQSDLSPETYAFGMTVIQAALAKKVRSYLFLSLAGAVSLNRHQRARAINYAEEAVDSAKQDTHVPAAFLQYLKHNLNLYEHPAAHHTRPASKPSMSSRS